MKQALIRPIESIVPRAARGYGGKALHLAALARAGFPVPRAFAVKTEAAERFYAEALPAEERPGRLFAMPALPGEALLDHARRRLLQAPVPPDIAEALTRAFHQLQGHGAQAVAVRSSSTGEDQESASAAGMHLSFLQVDSVQALLHAVRACWASVLQPRVLTYLRSLGADPNTSMGVVIQAMVPADLAGVLFTVNPLTGDPYEMVLNAAYGLGTVVTDGVISPDTYRIDKRTGWVRDRVIGDKRIQVLPGATGGTLEVHVPEERAGREALDEPTLQQLIELGRRVERHFGDARDVEWAVTGDAIYLLQARPIAAAQAHDRALARRRLEERDQAQMVWSNANVGEALPGVATPLTWSVLSDFSDIGFRRAFEALGCRVPAHAVLVGNFRGRIYLNLTELAHIAAQAPGVTPERLLALAGGRLVDLDLEEVRRGQRAFWARLPFTVARYLRDHVRLVQRLEVHEREFRSEVTRIESVDLRILDAAALDHTLSDVERLLDVTGAFTLTAYGHLLATHFVLQRGLELACRKPVQALMHELLASLQRVESAAPARELARIARGARDEPEVVARLVGDRLDGLEALPPGRTRHGLERFLARYGHRGVREAELSEPRWAEDPSTVLHALGGYLRSPNALPLRDDEARPAATELLRRALPLPFRFGPGRAALNGLVSLLLHYLRLREHLRDQVVRVLGLLRHVALDVSRRIVAREPECGEDAAFFLTAAEIHDYLRGRRSLVGPAVRRRRMQYDRDRALPDPPDSFVGYPPPPSRIDRSRLRLSGLAASAGDAMGRARVLRSPGEFGSLQAGEIMVVRHADVGWSPLFLLAGGVVTDVGGPLSHAAVILREYGVPAVFNVAQATAHIETGDLIRVDGLRGEVEVLERASAVTPEALDATHR